ncbi:MAG: ABC transporter permease [Alphaproteobacteria bacterium]|nr:ABC transporter permease [Alphaproteobacteria bacterium]
MLRRKIDLPLWVDYILLPLLNLIVALFLSCIIAFIAGADPIDTLQAIFLGAFGDGESIGYTFYYTTNFIFTGLAVSIAFHAGLFNIGAEGQALMGGLGVALICLYFDSWSLFFVLPFAIIAAGLLGGLWAFIPGFLQAKRGSHIVITTIMFNFIAQSLMVYLLVDILREPNQQNPQSSAFNEALYLPFIHDWLSIFHINIDHSPLNLSFLIALLCCLFLWIFIWHTRWGYEFRVVGQNHQAASYAGISSERTIIWAMVISGGLAGLVGINEIMGVHHRLILGFTGGAGYVGIAVALMGRNHPLGIIIAAILFGALYQGGSVLAFDIPILNKDIIIVIQGLIVLFCGALENIFKPAMNRLFNFDRTSAHKSKTARF